MDTIKYTESMNRFVETLLQTTGAGNVERSNGRRFDRLLVNGKVRFFVDRTSWEIYGAKSSFQFNPRRWYGTLDSVSQYDWAQGSPSPKTGTSAERIFNERESEIVKNYKPRGRPRKNPVTP